jgi:ligand-binding sensor domain-containing protein
MLKKISPSVLFFSFLVIANFSAAQTRYKGWEVYTSFKNVKSVDSRGSQVWAGTTGGMFNFDANSNPPIINKFTTQNGLRNTELNAIVIDNSGSVWGGAYDGSISVYNPGSDSWRYVTDIQISTENDKRINNMFQYGNAMFIATQFSVIKFDVNLFQFIDQPYIYLGPLIPVNTPVNKLIVVNDTVWAATVNGIAYADVRNYLPIRTNWANFITNNSILRSNHINTVASFNGKVYFGTDSGMVSYSNNVLSQYAPIYNGNPVTDPVIDISVSGNSMYFATFIVSGNIFRVDASNKNEAQLFASGISVNCLEAGSDGNLYIGTPNNGVLKNNPANAVLPNGPNSNVFFNICTDVNQNVWGCSEGVYVYNGTTWKNYTVESYPQMGSNNYIHVYASPFTGYLWASGFGSGLLRINGDELVLFNNTNSCLRPFSGDFVVIEAVGEDHDGFLWVINRAPNDNLPIVKVLNANLTDCIRYPSPDPNSTTFKFMAIDNYGTKWLTDHPSGDEGTGICYFNEVVNSQLTIPAGSLGADMNSVNHVIADKNGEIWIGTDNGIAIIADPYQVIQNPNSAPTTFKMRVIENGISTPLTENCKALAVDALNNKWIATLNNGLLYVSPDGSTILAKFNTSNSPLLDNTVGGIAVDSKSGKAYFGTQKGLVSYQTVAIEPLTDCSKITAGPNPFIIPNDNLLRIDGLVEGSSVKILTLSGVLVSEFESPGGRIANWNGRDQSGNLVATGIYIIAGFNKDASKVCTGKVAVIRK